MVRHYFRYRQRSDAPWQTGTTVGSWDVYVRRFFGQFPNGELIWVGQR